MIPLFVSALLRGEAPTIYGDGEQSRDFTYVANAVAANLLACDASAAAGEVFNIACNEQTSLNRLYARLQDLLGKTIPAVHGPPRPGDVRHSLADIDKAKRLLGYLGEVKFDEGLQRSIAWYRRTSEAGTWSNQRTDVLCRPQKYTMGPEFSSTTSWRLQ